MQQGQANNTCLASEARSFNNPCKSSQYIYVLRCHVFTPIHFASMVYHTHFAQTLSSRSILASGPVVCVFHCDISSLLRVRLLFIIYDSYRAILRLVHVIAHNLLRTLASFAFLLHHIRINQSHHTLSLVSWPVSSPLLYRAIHAIHKILYINTSREDHRWYRMQNVIFPHTTFITLNLKGIITVTLISSVCFTKTYITYNKAPK